jgi:CheY-like chemotaxis protein
MKRSEQLRKMAAELTMAEHSERKRLAQILHDGLQQILVGAKYQVANITRKLDPDEELDYVKKLIEEAIETSRSLTAELSPPVLLHGNLYAALEWLGRWMHEHHGLDMHLAGRKKSLPLNEGVLLLLFQATRELLFNVVKHAGVRAAFVEIDELEEQVQVTVRDQGPGFDLAEPLIRGGYSSGMGLFSINERLSYMGGRLEIDSTRDRGTCLRLIAPISKGLMVTDKQRAGKNLQVSVALSPQSASEPASAGKRTRILLVDDHTVMREGLAGLLRHEPDFEIVGEASDGESAVRLAREAKPDILLMDVNMPGMNGVEATRIIHEELPEVIIIGLSMHDEAAHAAAILEAGAVDYLTKSEPSDAIIGTIRKLCRVRSVSEVR